MSLADIQTSVDALNVALSSSNEKLGAISTRLTDEVLVKLNTIADLVAKLKDGQAPDQAAIDALQTSVGQAQASTEALSASLDQVSSTESDVSAKEDSIS